MPGLRVVDGKRERPVRDADQLGGGRDQRYGECGAGRHRHDRLGRGVERRRRHRSGRVDRLARRDGDAVASPTRPQAGQRRRRRVRARRRCRRGRRRAPGRRSRPADPIVRRAGRRRRRGSRPSRSRTHRRTPHRPHRAREAPGGKPDRADQRCRKRRGTRLLEQDHQVEGVAATVGVRPADAGPADVDKRRPEAAPALGSS